MTEKDVYQFYNEHVKPAYSEIEAAGNKLPVELLFEIHSAFDHIKRFHVDNQTEESCCEQAFSHLKRGLLDAFKIKLKYFNNDYEALIGKSIKDLRLVDNGTYLPKVVNARTKIIEVAKEARINEGRLDIDIAFDKWYEVSVLISEFKNKYLIEDKIQWAKANSIRQGIIGAVIGFIIGVTASVVAGFIMEIL